MTLLSALRRLVLRRPWRQSGQGYAVGAGLASAESVQALANILNKLEVYVTLMHDNQQRQERLNMLVARGVISGLMQNKVDEVPSVSPPQRSLPLEEQFSVLAEKAPLNIEQWKQTFSAGEEAYSPPTDADLSVSGHLEAGYFRMFVNAYAEGRVLDIGTGPLPVPVYLADIPVGRLAGIDPLPPITPHPFIFAQTYAEFLPWEDCSFETVTVGTSLDHVYLLDVALDEIARVLTVEGKLLLWTGLFEDTVPYDPYSAVITPPDRFHLFHPGKNWFWKVLADKFDVLETIEIQSGNYLIALEKK